MLKKAAITTAAVAIFSVGTAYADGGTLDDISTVYHVYLNNEYIGTVDNKEIIDTLIDNKINTENTYDQYDLTIARDLSYIPEKMFHPVFNNNKTVETVSSSIKVMAQASAITINDEAVAYLQDDESAKETIKQLKLKYVSEDVLTDLENQKQLEVELQALEEGQSRILDVSLSEKVTVSEEKIAPNEILTVDQAIELLQKGTLEEKKYSVKAGDVLGQIAVDHDLSTEELLMLNPEIDEGTLLQIGQELNVTAYEPYVNVIVKEEKYISEEISYETEVVEDSTMYKGDKRVKQEGREGEKLVNYVVSRQDGQQVNRDTVSEEIIKEPVKEIILKGTKVVPSRGTGDFVWPTSGGVITSPMGYRWGKLHKGIDVAGSRDLIIKAADNGVVTSAGWNGGYGKKIVITHNNGMKTVYAHLASISVSVGQTVPKGSQIGIMGTTGDSTGVHLHFEVYKNGNLLNPLSLLP